MNPAAHAFCRMFDVEVPIINAPMANISGGALAGAVASAGGLGLIGGGYGDLPWIEEQHGLAGGQGVGRGVGIGLITWAVAERPELIDRLIDIGFRTFFYSFGDPAALIGRVHGAGGHVLCQIQTVDEAERVVDSGADALIAQGNEAGGHGRDNEPADTLTALVIAAVAPTPVLAAGAKSTSADLIDAWHSGAAGILLGTRMYATAEAIDTPAAKQRLVDASNGDTIRTTTFDLLRGPEWPPGYNGRALKNAATQQWHGNEDKLRRSPERPQADYRHAAATGDLGQRVVWAGTGVHAIEAVTSAATVVRNIANGAKQRGY